MSGITPPWWDETDKVLNDPGLMDSIRKSKRQREEGAEGTLLENFRDLLHKLIDL